MTDGSVVDCTSCTPPGESEQEFSARALNTMSQGLGGSQILRIAGEIKELQAQGQDICNLTVGDFSPAEFRIPESMATDIGQALREGQTSHRIARDPRSRPDSV